MFSKAKYSCEPKTYLNDKSSLVGIKSNSKTATSLILLTVKFCPIKAGTELATFNKSGSVTAGTTSIKSPNPAKLGSNKFISPVDKTIPLPKPRLEFDPSK